MDGMGMAQRTITEVDGLSERLGGFAASAVALRPGLYAGTLSTLELGGLRVQILRSAPAMILGGLGDGEAGVALFLRGRERARWNGRKLGGSDVVQFGDPAEHAAGFPDDFTCLLLHFSVDGQEGAMPALPGALTPRPGERRGILRAGRREHDRVATLARAAQRFASDPHALRDADTRRALRSNVLEATRRLVASAAAAGDTERAPGRHRSIPAHQRVVHAADAYLHADPARPVYTEDLCRVLGVSASRLAEAFRAVFDVSPHRYLKMRRMGLVRAALLAGSSPWRSVKGAALSYGFWHLGQFAHDYRALYGESPSETLARGLGADPSGTGRPAPTGAC